MSKIKKIKLFVNNNVKSKKASKKVLDELELNGFEIVEEDFDLGIAVGGDGAFLRMIKSANFNSKALFVGINVGTLGFAQDISIKGIKSFIESIKNDDYQEEEIGVEEVEVTTTDSISRFFALNEIVVRDEELNTTGLDVFIDDNLLEKYVGDGLLVSTSFGSTAYNLSFGGSIVYNTFHTLQITPVAPLNNKSYRNLLNSIIIPTSSKVTLIPTRNEGNLIITSDGDNCFYNNVLKIDVIGNTRTIKIIRKNEYNFIEKINEKFLK